MNPTSLRHHIQDLLFQSGLVYTHEAVSLQQEDLVEAFTLDG